MRGYRDPTRQAKRWAAAAERPCPAGCPHPVCNHHEYPRGDEELGIPRHPRYAPGRFRCDNCPCEVEA